MNEQRHGSRPELEDHLDALGLPADFCTRKAESTSRVRRVLERFERDFESRKFLLGLLIAFVGVAEELLRQIRQKSMIRALEKYRPRELDRRGRRSNTLTIDGPEAPIGLRPYYNRVEQVILGTLRQRDYPNCAPHATQAWPQHRVEVDAIFEMEPGERAALVEDLWDRALDMHEFESRRDVEQVPRPFTVLLDEFPERIERVPAGAILQGLAFAYYRADAPNVTIETRKVGAGGARTGNVGDVDGWSGGALVLSIEVKDMIMDKDRIEGLSPFFRNLAGWPNATAIVVARSITSDAEAELLAQKTLSLDRARLRKNVLLWDLRKQQLAMREFEYFSQRIQKSSPLMKCLETFVARYGLKY